MISLIEIVERWIREDEFLSIHFIVKQSPRSKSEATVNMGCFHDSNNRSWDKFICWITDTTIETDIDCNLPTPKFQSNWIKLHPSDPTFFDDLRKLLYEVHRYYRDYCKPKWTPLKK